MSQSPNVAFCSSSSDDDDSSNNNDRRTIDSLCTDTTLLLPSTTPPNVKSTHNCILGRLLPSKASLLTCSHRMLPYSVSALSWQVQVPLLAGVFTLLWLALKLWRSVRERQIRIIPASWNGIHAHQWSLIQCLTHRATCCVCRSLIVDAMLCTSCGVCLDFTCYQSYISRFGALMKKARVSSAGITSAAKEDGESRRASVQQQPLSTLGVCKAVSTPAKDSKEGGSILGPHHWVHGNLPAHSKCFICADYCDDESELGEQTGIMSEPLAEHHTLHHYRCCYCQRTVHEGCFERHQGLLKTKEDSSSETFSRCDYGKWKRYIIPPGAVIHRRVWSSRARGRAIALEEIKDFRACDGGSPDWEPLFVVANRAAGNNDAGAILARFRAVLNPLQVIELGGGDSAEASLELALQMCNLLPVGVKTRFLVAGGDGTVGWVLNTVQRIMEDSENDPPAVAIFPLGTGNDLARVLGWSAEQSSSSASPIEPHRQNANKHPDSLVESIYSGGRVQLDRWTVDIRPTDYYHRSRSLLLARLHIPKAIMPPGVRSLSMYNYLSVGADALVTLNFHETRKSWLYKFFFTNTLVNKFLYFTYGTKNLWERRCTNVQRKVSVELDGVPVTLPEVESVTLLNIPSWGGGARFSLPKGNNQLRQSVSDGLIEVYGLTGSFHIAQVIMGLASPIFIGQARSVRLSLLEHLPMQADGEPWLQSPAVIDVTWNSSATVLRAASGSWIDASGVHQA